MQVMLPYGSGSLYVTLPETGLKINTLLPQKKARKIHESDQMLVENALTNPLKCKDPFLGLSDTTTVAITVNDKTRPVPNDPLILPLIRKLRSAGVRDKNITLFIASGTHLPMGESEFHLILGREIVDGFQIVAHNCDDNNKLYEIGSTFRKTPIAVNKEFYDHDLKIVVGNIELHHFAGFSGGVKSAAIGLCGRQTINANHHLLLDQYSTIGEYDNNPLRQDIEEIGEMIGVNYALNAVLTENKEIIEVFFGDPIAVMRAGIELVKELTLVPVDDLYDLVIASAGGFPKDINLYQSQKAMTHAARFLRENGSIILFAECREGVGSQGYLDYMDGMKDYEQVIEKFSGDTFKVGPHKAYQVARILEKHRVYLFSSIEAMLVKKLLLSPLDSPDSVADLIHKLIPDGSRIAVLPYATACMPTMQGGLRV